MSETLVAVDGWRYEAAEEKALALETLLGRHGVAIACGSPLEAAVLNAMAIAERRRTGDHTVGDADVRDSYRRLVGMHELATLLLSVGDHPSFHALVPHLKLLNEGAVLQNTTAHGADSATNKLFELWVAAVAMSIGNDVALDHPVRASGTNPDVLVTLGGRRWGFACKVLHSTSPEGFFEHLRKGIQQIEVSEADVGVVVLNLKNVIQHDIVWPLSPELGSKIRYPAAWRDEGAAYHALQEESGRIGRRVNEERPEGWEILQQAVRNAKSLPAVLLWAHSVAGVIHHGRPTPTSLRLMQAVRFGHMEPQDALVLEDLTWAAMPDSPLRGPPPSARRPEATTAEQRSNSTLH